jgi:hypothetical protein
MSSGIGNSRCKAGDGITGRSGSRRFVRFGFDFADGLIFVGALVRPAFVLIHNIALSEVAGHIAIASEIRGCRPKAIAAQVVNPDRIRIFSPSSRR